MTPKNIPHKISWDYPFKLSSSGARSGFADFWAPRIWIREFFFLQIQMLFRIRILILFASNCNTKLKIRITFLHGGGATKKWCGMATLLQKNYNLWKAWHTSSILFSYILLQCCAYCPVLLILKPFLSKTFFSLSKIASDNPLLFPIEWCLKSWPRW
jgi:hypothetical protein